MSRRAKGEGSIRLRPDGRYEATLSLQAKAGKRQRRSFFGRTKAEAAAKMKAAQRSVDDNVPLPPERLTVKAHLESWLIEKKKVVRPDSYESYETICRLHIIPHLDSIKLKDLEVADVQRMDATLALHLSGTTCQMAHMVLHAALQDAVRRKVLARNVVSLVTAPRRSTPEMRFLSPDDAKELLMAARGDRLQALYVLALTSGLREGELQALRWKDVDLDRRRVVVQATLTAVREGAPVFGEPKTQRSRRTVWLSEVAVESLRLHRDAQQVERIAAGPAWREFSLVFCNEMGSPLWRSQIWRSFGAVVKKAGLDHLRFHDLRHSAATILLAEGTPIRVVSEMLGHADVSTTLSIYAHVIEGAQEQATSTMDRLFHA